MIAEISSKIHETSIFYRNIHSNNHRKPFTCPFSKKRNLGVVQIIYAPQHWRSQWKLAFWKGKESPNHQFLHKLFYYVSFRDQTSMDNMYPNDNDDINDDNDYNYWQLSW